MTVSAERSDTSCSLDCPPNSTATRTLPRRRSCMDRFSPLVMVARLGDCFARQVAGIRPLAATLLRTDPAPLQPALLEQSSREVAGRIRERGARAGAGWLCLLAERGMLVGELH